MPALAFVPRFIALSAVLYTGVAVAEAQVPAPAAEPGSLPETQPATSATQPTPQTASANLKPGGPARVAGGVVSGLRLGGDTPVYPAEAKAKGIGGRVVMHAIVGKDGHIDGLKVISGDPLLADSAWTAVKTWTYRPYLLNGEPTEVDTTVTVNFNLRSGPNPMLPQGGPPGSDGQQAGLQPGQALPTTPERTVRISGGVMAGQKVSGDAPRYPAEAREQHIGGSVVLHAIIGTNGLVQNLTVVSGSPALQRAALDAVKTWVYKPFLLNGEPVTVDTTITVNFFLTSSPTND